MTPAEAALLAQRSDRRHRLRDPRRGRRLRRRRPVAALGPGRGHRRRGRRQPEHDRRAGNREPGHDAMARQGQGDRRKRGIRGRPAARPSPRCSPATVNPSGRLPITFPADLAQTPRPELPAWAHRGARRPPSTTTKARRSATAGSQDRGQAAVRVRPRPELHDLRLQRPPGQRRGDGHRQFHGDQHRASARAPTYRSSI